MYMYEMGSDHFADDAYQWTHAFLTDMVSVSRARLPKSDTADRLIGGKHREQTANHQIELQRAIRCLPSAKMRTCTYQASMLVACL